MQCHITGLDEATNTFYGWTTNSWESAKLMDQVQSQYRIYPISDISLNDVSFTSMTVHMETVYAADKNVTVSMFPGTATVAMDSSDASMSTSLVLEATDISMDGRNRFRGESAKLGGRQCNHRTEYSDSPIFRSTTCPLLP
jgi:hypothetical protein